MTKETLDRIRDVLTDALVSKELQWFALSIKTDDGATIDFHSKTAPKRPKGLQREFFFTYPRAITQLCADALGELTALRERVSQLEADAGRYRWLRNKQMKSNRLPYIAQYPYQPEIDEREWPQVMGCDGTWLPENVDAAIDAAMREAKA